jgi:vacuolar protein sorting-associated protein 72
MLFQEEDDFYKTTYGGFNDEGDDMDFNEDAHEDEDEVDSDFSIDENEEVKSDPEDDESSRRKVGASIM